LARETTCADETYREHKKNFQKISRTLEKYQELEKKWFRKYPRPQVVPWPACADENCREHKNYSQKT
jgi:hypothetical protein